MKIGTKIDTVNGLEIWESGTGGSAGKGSNKTASIQVRKPEGKGGYILLKTIRYTINDEKSKDTAIFKARMFANNKWMWPVQFQ